MEKTIWRSVEGYEEKYEVSNFAEVRFKKTKKIVNRVGTRISLMNSPGEKASSIHIKNIVADAFLPNPDNKKGVVQIVKNRDYSVFNLIRVNEYDILPDDFPGYDEEVWRFVIGSNFYMVSNFGRCKHLPYVGVRKLTDGKISLVRNNSSLLSTSWNSELGGMAVKIMNKKFRVDKLVLRAFSVVESEDFYPYHKDGDGKNCKLCNLGVSKDPVVYHNIHKDTRIIHCIDDDRYFLGVTRCSEHYNISRFIVNKLLNGDSSCKLFGKYHFEYVNHLDVPKNKLVEISNREVNYA